MKMEPRHIAQALGNARRILMRWMRKSPRRFWSGEGPDESEVSHLATALGLSKHAIRGASRPWGFAPVDL